MKIEDELLEIRHRIDALIGMAWDSTDEYEFPQNVREATAEDIRVGQVLWYKRHPQYVSEGEKDYYFQVVSEVLHPDDKWKAYAATDGCLYGLDGAYVELEK